MSRVHLVTALALATVCNTTAYGQAEFQTTWQIDNVTNIGGHATTVIGDPEVVVTPFGNGMLFDGDDGLIIDDNPIAGAATFTLEMIFRPDAIVRGSSGEPRVFHVQSSGSDHRAILETRVTGDEWYLDAFLRSRSASDPRRDENLTLVDSSIRYPLGEWYNYSVVYDGTAMHAYLDGQLQLSGPIAVEPLSAGQTSLGMRHNRVSFFEGAISQVRFTRSALEPSEFLVVPEPSSFALISCALVLCSLYRHRRRLPRMPRIGRSKPFLLGDTTNV